jgi:hypothetical protein
MNNFMKNRLPYIILPIILAVLGSQKALSQADLVDINIQYNNKTDRESENALTVEDISEKKIALDEILNTTEFYASGNITLQIVFYDRTALGPFQLKEKHKNLTAETYVTKWNTKHSNEKRILMLFVKDQHDGNYEFSNFEVSNLPHIFPVVENYIQEQIMAKTNTHAEAVNDGLNALKNAYDESFFNTMKNKGPEYIDESIYHKNHAYWGPQNYYNFYSYHAEENENEGASNESDIDNTYLDIDDKDYQDMVDEISDNELVKSDDYFDWSDFDNPEITGPELSISFTPYPQDFLNSIQDQELMSAFTETEETTLSLPQAVNDHFPETDYSGNTFHSRSYLEDELKEIAESPLHTDSYETSTDFPDVHNENHFRYRKHNCRVKIDHKQVKEGEQLNNRAREVILGKKANGALKSYVYCNKYVEDMLELIFPKNKQGDGLFWGTGLTANGIYDKLTQSSYHDVIDVSDQDKEQIWDYIDEGYIVIVVWKNKGGIGHTVLGWPEENKVIGAGRTSRKNEYEAEFGLSKNPNRDISFFIYSGHLSKNY